MRLPGLRKPTPTRWARRAGCRLAPQKLALPAHTHAGPPRADQISGSCIHEADQCVGPLSTETVELLQLPGQSRGGAQRRILTRPQTQARPFLWPSGQ
jgi:hypothetical protein